MNPIRKDKMKLIIGLGNPGQKYQNTRHNIGFQVADSFLEKKEKWRKSKKANCLYFRKQIGQQEIEIIKPLTFMNNSGLSVKYAFKKHGLHPENIIVVHDDIDIDFGKIRISKDRSSAGHNGVQSIINHLKTKNFIRIRIGIASEQKNNDIASEKFVLKNFSRKEKGQLLEIIALGKQIIVGVLENGLEKTMNQYN